jgi:hypothetical protein
MLSRQHDPRYSGTAPSRTSADVVAHDPPNSRAGAIQIRQGDAGRLIVVAPYTAERVAKIKTVAGRR